MVERGEDAKIFVCGPPGLKEAVAGNSRFMGDGRYRGESLENRDIGKG